MSSNSSKSENQSNGELFRTQPNIILVDDNELLLSAMRRWLKRALGWTVSCFADPIDGLRHLKTHTEPVDIMIVDLKMPEMNGIEFLTHARLIHEEAIHILMTGHDYHDIVVEAINRLDLYFFMEKPWDPQKLALVLHNAWEKKKLTVSLEKRIHDFEDTFRKLQVTQLDLVRHKNQAAIGELIQGICHNLNSPLSAIMGHLELIQMRLKQAEGDSVEVEKLQPSVDLVHQASEKIGQIISNLMIKSRMEQTPKKQHIAIDKLISQEMEFLQADHFLKHHVNVQMNLDPEVPELWINYSDFSQVFGNLVRNALDAVSGIDEPRLEIKTYGDKKSTILEIHDNGPGVPSDIRKDIFVPFFTTKIPVDELEEDENAEGLRSHGVGLGLHSVVQLLEPYEGEIVVTDSHLGGACFRVTLPLPSADLSSGLSNSINGLDS